MKSKKDRPKTKLVVRPAQKATVVVTTQHKKQKRQPNRVVDVTKMSILELKHEAYRLYLEHHSEYDIGIALGKSQSTISNYIQDALVMKTEELEKITPHIRALEIQRCDQHILHWYAASKHDVRASELLLHWTERKHKILGTDISRSEISGPGGGPITINAHSLDLKKLNARQLANLEEIMRIAGPQDQKVLTYDQPTEDED